MPIVDKIATELQQHLLQLGFWVPSKSAPNHLVDIIVATFGIGQKPNRSRLRFAENDFFSDRPWVDAFACLRNGVGDIPILHRKLTLPGVGDVRVVPNWILSR